MIIKHRAGITHCRTPSSQRHQSSPWHTRPPLLGYCVPPKIHCWLYTLVVNRLVNRSYLRRTQRCPINQLIHRSWGRESGVRVDIETKMTVSRTNASGVSTILFFPSYRDRDYVVVSLLYARCWVYLQKLALVVAQLFLVPCFQAVAQHRSWPGLLCPQPRPALERHPSWRISKTNVLLRHYSEYY